MALNRKLITWISNTFPKKTIISINNQLSHPIPPICGILQDSPLSLILLILYLSDITKPSDAQVNLSQFVENVATWTKAPCVRRNNLAKLT